MREEEPDYEEVDINSVHNSRIRTIGAEYVGVSIFRKLGLDVILKGLGFSKKEIEISILSIVGRLVHPGSEKRTKEWAQHLSGLDELLGTDFKDLSNNALYRVLDGQLSHKEEIERHLRRRERSLFSLKEKIILYDLTNTYFEGEKKKDRKAKRGKSKERRNDCPLVTLGLVLDESEFPKTSKIFKGNVSEPTTLKEMIEALEDTRKDLTVVLDAGIATEDNLHFLKEEGYDYICIARNKPISPFSRVTRKIVSRHIIIPLWNIASGKFYLADIPEILNEDEVFSRESKSSAYISKAHLYPVSP
jgi:transposase